MTPLMLISLLAFVAVAAIVGALTFVFRGNAMDTSTRLDILVGKRRKEDAGADILRKTAFDHDKRSLLEAITPKMPSLEKVFEQAECHIKPSQLIGIGIVLALVGGTLSWMAHVPIFLAPLAGVLLFMVPCAWLWN